METNEEYAAACFAGSTITAEDLPERPACQCWSHPVTGEEHIVPGCDIHAERPTVTP